MNPANSLLNLLSFKLKDKYEKENLAQMQSISVATVVMVIFFAVISALSFFESLIIQVVVLSR